MTKTAEKSSGDNNGRVGVWVCSPTKLKIPKAEQETAQPTAARFNITSSSLQLFISVLKKRNS